MLKRIIVLIDLSESSKKLLAFGNSLAENSGAGLLVVHQTFSLAPGLGDAEIRSDIDLQSKRKALTRLANFVSDAGVEGLGMRLHVTTRNLDNTILSLKAIAPNDVIIVGVKGKSWLERLFIHGTAVKLVNAIANIIVAVPDSAFTPDLSKLHIAVTPKYPLNHNQLKNLLSTGGGTTGNVRFISVLPDSNDQKPLREYLQSLCDLYSPLAEVSYELLQAGNTLAAVRNYIISRKGVLVIQRGPRNFSDIFRKYFATDLIYDAQIPTVILP